MQTVGLILIIVGIIGLVISLAIMFMAIVDRSRRPDDYPTRRLKNSLRKDNGSSGGPG